MSNGWKIAAIVGAAGIGAYAIAKMTAPKRTVVSGTGTSRTPVLNAQQSVAFIGGLINTVGGLFGGAAVPNTSNPIVENSGGFSILPSEQRNIDAYDALGTSTNPVYGIAGIDY